MMEKESKGFYRELFALVLPIACQNLVSAMVSASDALMLGMQSQEAMSAVSLAAKVQFVLSLFTAALTIGTTVLAAQYWGKGDREVVEQVLAIAVRLSLLVSAVFFLAAFFTPRSLMRIFTGEEALISAGAKYLRAVSWSYLAAAFSQIYLCIMKNSGRTFRSMVYGICAMLSNILLNAVLIFGLFGAPALGIRGAACATVAARLLELGLTLAENGRRDVVSLKAARLVRRYPSLWRDFRHYTAPVLLNELVWGCGFTMFTVIMGHLGEDAVAANSYANIVKNLIACFCLGLGTGSGILIGNQLGQGNLAGARRDGARLCRIAVLSGTASGLVILLLTPFVLSHVGTLAETAHGYLKVMLYICSYYMIGKSVNSTLVSGIFCAGGDTRFGLLMDTLAMWGIIIPAGLLAAFVLKLPVVWVYFILNLDEFVKLPFVYRNYKKEKWVKNLTREEEQGTATVK